MPYATVYRYNRVALDTNTMDNHTDVEGNVAWRSADGALVRARADRRKGNHYREAWRTSVTVWRDSTRAASGITSGRR